MTAFHDAPDEFLSADMRHNFDGRQPGAGMSDVRTQLFGIVRENLATLPTARDADVKLLLADGR